MKKRRGGGRDWCGRPAEARLGSNFGEGRHHRLKSVANVGRLKPGWVWWPILT